MHWFRAALVMSIAATGCHKKQPKVMEEHGERPRAPREQLPPLRDDGTPSAELRDVHAETLCVTKGQLARSRVDVPTFRAVAPGLGGDAASLKVRVHGASSETRALASGQERRQLGLKLRAADGCNLVYVMWRLDPRPMLEVSVKHNPGARTSAECGNGGYTKVKAQHTEVPPTLDDGSDHELRAEIHGDTLVAWIDGREAWRGQLPDEVRDLDGPAGMRSDNLSFDVVGFGVDQRLGVVGHAKCVDSPSD